MPDYNPESILETIEGWITEEGKFKVKPHDDPRAHFSIYMSEVKELRSLIPILIVYPKSSPSNTIIVSWGWRMHESYTKSLRAIKDKDKRIQKVIGALKKNCLNYNINLWIAPNESNFGGVKVAKLVFLNRLTKTTFKKITVELWAMWALLMHLLKKYYMARRGTSLSDLA
ncbi:MAG: hypothetical protein M3146_07360 [Thermoproteota archaeon]|nr:hypothetical protein [Thermoproteota archaeon]